LYLFKRKYIIFFNFFKNPIKINIKFPDTPAQESWNFKGQVKQIQSKPKEKLFEIKLKALKELQSGNN
jgi:hypothetical protein